jgi:DNA-binding NarL/FixJ family response regulator
MNPWNLTPRQTEILDALVEVGCNKLVARQLGVNVRTLETHMARAFARMQIKNRMVAVIAWDRYRRGYGKAD